MIYTRAFWLDLGERVLATAAQSAVGAWAAITVTNITAVETWQAVGVAALVGAGLAALKGIAASYTGARGTPQLGVATYTGDDV